QSIQERGDLDIVWCKGLDIVWGCAQERGDLERIREETPSFGAKVEAFSTSKDVVLSKIKSFPKGTSCGRDGLRAQHLVDALGKAALIVADDLVSSITACPSSLGEFIASAPLTPLLKPGGCIRPIVVGTVWRRLVSKIVAFIVRKEVGIYLEDFQFGMGVPNGDEAIFHAVNRLIEAKGGAHNISMLLVYFSNAFNLIDRSTMLSEVRCCFPSLSPWVEFCYEHPARLYYDEASLLSCQGDPLGPLMFALTLHPLVHRINEECNLEFMAWYLDDGTIIGDTAQVLDALHLIIKEGSSMGLHLNVEKTEIFWPNPDPRSNDPMLFSQKIARPLDGVKLLGGPVSLDIDFCSRLIEDRVSKT
ncbi:hypothetical protein V2J09_020889, partial [Rumex salicifolius]